VERWWVVRGEIRVGRVSGASALFDARCCFYLDHSRAFGLVAGAEALEFAELEELNPYTSPIVLQIVAPLRDRLQAARPVLLEMPVSVRGHRQLVLRIDAGSDPRAEVEAFCARYPIIDSNWLLQTALSRLHPDATTVLSAPPIAH
jgi:hypothetical protein